MIQRYLALIIFLTLIGATVSQAATLLNHVAGLPVELECNVIYAT
jgi:hypothetical protein